MTLTKQAFDNINIVEEGEIADTHKSYWINIIGCLETFGKKY